MKIFISVDMEGISGLTSWKEMEQDVKRANKNITEDVNAAIRGIKRAEVPVDEILDGSGIGGQAQLIEQGVQIVRRGIHAIPPAEVV